MSEKNGLIPRNAGKGGVPPAWLLVGAAVLGVLLMIMSNTDLSAGRKEEETQAVSADMEDYARALEERIRVLCESVEGVGEARVAVSLESGYRRIYAQEDSSYLLVGSGSSRGTVHLTDEPPQIGGIAVVCTGGGDPTVCRRLVGLLGAAYDVGAHQIYIAQAQNEDR